MDIQTSEMTFRKQAPYEVVTGWSSWRYVHDTWGHWQRLCRSLQISVITYVFGYSFFQLPLPQFQSFPVRCLSVLGGLLPFSFCLSTSSLKVLVSSSLVSVNTDFMINLYFRDTSSLTTWRMLIRCYGWKWFIRNTRQEERTQWVHKKMDGSTLCRSGYKGSPRPCGQE